MYRDSSQDPIMAKVHARLAASHSVFTHAATAPLVRDMHHPHAATSSGAHSPILQSAVTALAEQFEKLTERVSRLETMFFVFETNAQKFGSSKEGGGLYSPNAPLLPDLRQLVRDSIAPLQHTLRHHESVLIDVVQTLNHQAAYNNNNTSPSAVAKTDYVLPPHRSLSQTRHTAGGVEDGILSPLTRPDVSVQTSEANTNQQEARKRLERIQSMATELTSPSQASRTTQNHHQPQQPQQQGGQMRRSASPTTTTATSTTASPSLYRRSSNRTVESEHLADNDDTSLYQPPPPKPQRGAAQPYSASSPTPTTTTTTETEVTATTSGGGNHTAPPILTTTSTNSNSLLVNVQRIVRGHTNSTTDEDGGGGGGWSSDLYMGGGGSHGGPHGRVQLPPYTATSTPSRVQFVVMTADDGTSVLSPASPYHQHYHHQPQRHQHYNESPTTTTATDAMTTTLSTTGPLLYPSLRHEGGNDETTYDSTTAASPTMLLQRHEQGRRSAYQERLQQILYPSNHHNGGGGGQPQLQEESMSDEYRELVRRMNFESPHRQ